MRVINLTAHDVTLLGANGVTRKVFEPSGHIARVVQTYDTHGTIEELDVDIEVVKPINILNFDGIIIEPYNIYLVSWLFLQAMQQQCHPNLHQFVAPNTNGLAKDFKGVVKGVENFLVLA